MIILAERPINRTMAGIGLMTLVLWVSSNCGDVDTIHLTDGADPTTCRSDVNNIVKFYVKIFIVKQRC